MWSYSIPTLFLAVFILPEIGAQMTDATCLPFYSWTFNSHMKSPCEVASALLAVCSGGSFMVAALPTKTHYLGPSFESTNPCQCNTVVYSLMSACAACQGRTFETWSTWSGNCATISINSYPEVIPSNTSVPGWAYLDVKTHDTFNETAARQNTNKLESTAIPSPTSNSIPSPAPASTSAESMTASDSRDVSVESKFEANVTMGGIVGGTFGLMIFIGVGLRYFSSRHRIAKSEVPLPPSGSQSVEELNDMRPYVAEILPTKSDM